MSFPLSPDPVSNRPVQTDPALAGRTDSTQPGNALAESWKATLAQSKPLFALRVLFNLTIVGAVIDAVATTVSHKVGKLGQNAQPVAPSRQSNPAGESTPAPGAIRRQAADLGRAITSMRSKPLEAGMQTDLAASVRALTRPGGGFAPKAVWDGMKSYRANLGRYAGLNTLSPAEAQAAGLAQMTRTVQALSATNLAAVYQTLQSREMALLKESWQADGRAHPGKSGVQAALADLFDLEAVVIKDVSERLLAVTSLAADPAADADLRQGHRFAARAEEGAAAYARDISPRNLKTLVETTAQSAGRAERTADATQAMLADRRIASPEGSPLNARALGDVLRGSELTMNIDPTFLFGPDGSIADRAWTNAFHLADRGITPRGEDYVAMRDEIERSVFPELSGQPARANERPLYAALNTQGNLSGAASMYGTCVLVLRPEAAQRSTFTVDDTFVTVPLQFDQARLDTFMRTLDTLPPDALPGLPPDVRDTLRNPDSKLRQDLAAELARAPLDEAMTLREFEERVGAGSRKRPAVENPWVRPLLVRAFGDIEAKRASTATFDTLENLLPHLGEVDGGSLMRAAATGQNKFSLQGRYIEAQVHGTFLPSRDVGEIRMDFSDLLDWKSRTLSTGRVNGIVEFARANNIKLVFTDPGELGGERDGWKQRAYGELLTLGVPVLTAEELNRATAAATNATDGQTFAAAHESISEAKARARALVSGETEEWQARLLSLLPPETDLTEVPLAGASLTKVKSRFIVNVDRAIAAADAEGRGINIETVISEAIRDAAGKLIARKATLLREMESLPFANAEQRTAFRDWVISAGGLTNPLEMRLIHANAMAQVTRLERLGPNPTLAALAAEFADGANALGQDIDTFRGQIPPGEFGPDDVRADFNRTAFMSVALLQAKNPALTAQLLDALDSPAGRNLRGVCFKLHGLGMDALFSPSGLGAARYTGDFMGYTADALAQKLDRPQAPAPGFNAELNFAPQSVREALMAAIPEFGRELSVKFPARDPRTILPFPAPTAPGSLATTTPTQRRQFLVGMLDRYRAHEETFDGDRGVHGLSHACRTFIFANVMSDLMRTRGAPVDKTAVLCAISAHDSGRAANGQDVYERHSAEIALQTMRTAFGTASFGADFETHLTRMIDDPDHGNQERALTLEALVMQSADSLDISRTQDFRPELFPFLRDPVTLPDGRILPPDTRVREQLAREAGVLQRLTDPAVQAQPRLTALLVEMAAADDPALVQAQIRAVNTTVREQLAELRQLSNEDYLARIEIELRTHAHEMPLLSRHYFQDAVPAGPERRPAAPVTPGLSTPLA